MTLFGNRLNIHDDLCRARSDKIRKERKAYEKDLPASTARVVLQGPTPTLTSVWKSILKHGAQLLFAYW